MDLSLGSGATADNVVTTLNHLVINVSQCVGPSAASRRDQYLGWMENAESQLRHLFADSRVAEHLLTDRYWHVRRLGDDDKRPMPLIDAEIAAQKEFLVRLAAQLQREVTAFGLPAGTVPLVVDTNVLLHFTHIDEAPWRDLVDRKPVRLVVPLLVIDELDEKSYASASTASKAKRVLRTMQRVRGTAAADAPVRLRDGVDWQIMMDPVGHERFSNSDEELLRRADHLARIAPGVVVVSADYGLRLRAQARGLQSVKPPDGWSLRQASDRHADDPDAK